LDSEGEFIVDVPSDQTITVQNPSNQLLIDTNYDGIYESGVTEFSSFEIRFRLNSTTPLSAGNGTFSFRSGMANGFTFTHKNLNAAAGNKASFQLIASCVPKDSDGDGVADAYDADSDNDGIPDLYESQGANFQQLSGTDPNHDGLDAIFDTMSTVADTDHDNVPDYLDLDSDNNGVYDLVESASGAADANNDGIIDGGPASFGTNGMSASISGSLTAAINYIPADSNSDGVWDYVSSDNDGDLCNDVLEAGFSDDNGDGYLGNNMQVAVNSQGVVLGSVTGYTSPNANYIIPMPIAVATQPEPQIITCEQQDIQITMVANPEVTYQWQVSTNDNSFSNIADSAVYSGSQTNTLTVHAVPSSLNGSIYRALLSRVGNICGSVSEESVLHVKALPPVVAKTLVQCDTGDNPDGFTLFNLSQADQSLTNSDPNLMIAYFLSGEDATDASNELPNEYTNISNPQVITAKITDAQTNCYSFSSLTLSVNTASNAVVPIPGICDELDSEDGFTQFDLTAAGIPVSSGQTLHYYVTETDALLEQNEIPNPANYGNLLSYTPQVVYARLETVNSCSRFYLIPLVVYRLPAIDANADLKPDVVCVNEPTFSTILDAPLSDGSSAQDYNYQWQLNGTDIPGATSPELTVTSEGTYSVTLTNSNNCSKTRYIPVIASSQAIIESVDVVDFTEENSVTVNLASNSYGHYVYSLDYQNAAQPSNVFTNVAAGIHTVYVTDLNGCPVASKEISVVGIPKFFTPNGDGFNDTWNVKGINARYNTHSRIMIFDRYGKFIKELGADGGWDGTYNGRPLPSSDYWYDIELEDGRSAHGHFSLKR
jgi:gliding motility-associated-like protein